MNRHSKSHKFFEICSRLDPSKEYTIQENSYYSQIFLADPRELEERKRKRDRSILLLFAKFPRTRGKTRQECSLSRYFLDIPAYICLGGGSITRRGPFEFPKGNSKLLNGYGELFKADARFHVDGVPRSIRIKATLSDPRRMRVKLADIFPTGVTLPSLKKGDYSFLLFLPFLPLYSVPLPRYKCDGPSLYISIDLSFRAIYQLFMDDLLIIMD